MLKQILAAFRGTTAPPSGKKITLGCGAVHHFIRQMHRNGIDRGAVASFGNTYEVEQTLTDQAGEVAGALMTVERRVLQGKREGTALYDSLVSLGESFARASYTRAAFGLVIAVTDGNDISSTRFKSNPALAGETYRRLIEASRNPVLSILIGVGSSKDIDEAALRTLAHTGGMQLVTVGNMAQVSEILATLGTQLQHGTVDRLITDGRTAVVARERFARLTVIPYDYAILLDRSGSMAEDG